MLHAKRPHARASLLTAQERLKRGCVGLPIGAPLPCTLGSPGLRTRRYVLEVLSIEFLRARRYDSPLAVMMADLDHFKVVNDTYGHPAGDAVLRGVSALLLSQLRATDVAGRYGGEEIIVVLAQSELEGAKLVAERWRENVESARFDSGDAQGLEARISIGLATYDPNMKTPDDLVAAADAALYRAKEAGRNRVETATD